MRSDLGCSFPRTLKPRVQRRTNNLVTEPYDPLGLAGWAQKGCFQGFVVLAFFAEIEAEAEAAPEPEPDRVDLVFGVMLPCNNFSN